MSGNVDLFELEDLLIPGRWVSSSPAEIRFNTAENWDSSQFVRGVRDTNDGDSFLVTPVDSQRLNSAAGVVDEVHIAVDRGVAVASMSLVDEGVAFIGDCAIQTMAPRFSDVVASFNQALEAGEAVVTERQYAERLIHEGPDSDAANFLTGGEPVATVPWDARHPTERSLDIAEAPVEVTSSLVPVGLVIQFRDHGVASDRGRTPEAIDGEAGRPDAPERVCFWTEQGWAVPCVSVAIARDSEFGLSFTTLRVPPESPLIAHFSPLTIGPERSDEVDEALNGVITPVGDSPFATFAWVVVAQVDSGEATIESIRGLNRSEARSEALKHVPAELLDDFVDGIPSDSE